MPGDPAHNQPGRARTHVRFAPMNELRLRFGDGDQPDQVTSPGGTTAAGLYELEKDALRATLSRAIFAAYRRSQELGALSEQKETK